jgi:predicted nuclease of predicted toxin-antitoxin system
MRLYLDDDIASGLLVQLLRHAGHDVVVPADLAIAGSEDPVHLRHAIREQRACLTQNYDDFRLLHELVVESRGHHPGIFVVRLDNDPRRDMRPAHIVRAVAKLIAAGVPSADEYIVLNHWR